MSLIEPFPKGFQTYYYQTIAQLRLKLYDVLVLILVSRRTEIFTTIFSLTMNENL